MERVFSSIEILVPALFPITDVDSSDSTGGVSTSDFSVGSCVPADSSSGIKLLGVSKLMKASIQDSIVFHKASEISSTVTLYSLSTLSSSPKTTTTLLGCPSSTSEISTVSSFHVISSSIINSLRAHVHDSRSVENISSILDSSITFTCVILKFTPSFSAHCVRVTCSSSTE